MGIPIDQGISSLRLSPGNDVSERAARPVSDPYETFTCSARTMKDGHCVVGAHVDARGHTSQRQEVRNPSPKSRTRACCQRQPTASSLPRSAPGSPQSGVARAYESTGPQSDSRRMSVGRAYQLSLLVNCAPILGARDLLRRAIGNSVLPRPETKLHQGSRCLLRLVRSLHRKSGPDYATLGHVIVVLLVPGSLSVGSSYSNMEWLHEIY